MNKKILILISIIFIVILILFNNLYQIINKVKYYIYDSKIDGPTILMLGGTHGNEPAGYHALNEFKKELDNKITILKRGKIIIIPAVNYYALKLGIRYLPLFGDLNRKYPYSLNNNKKSDSNIINQIIKLTQESDFILDFHEGWGYNRLNKKSMGSTITPTNTDKSHELAKIMLDSVNKKITDINKKFIILAEPDITKNKLNYSNYDYSKSIDIKGSLRYYQKLLNKDYILIETTGQLNVQPLNLRMEQNKIFIQKTLEYYQMV
jgi:hypothetical protein